MHSTHWFNTLEFPARSAMALTSVSWNPQIMAKQSGCSNPEYYHLFSIQISSSNGLCDVCYQQVWFCYIRSSYWEVSAPLFQTREYQQYSLVLRGGSWTLGAQKRNFGRSTPVCFAMVISICIIFMWMIWNVVCRDCNAFRSLPYPRLQWQAVEWLDNLIEISDKPEIAMPPVH